MRASPLIYVGLLIVHVSTVVLMNSAWLLWISDFSTLKGLDRIVQREFWCAAVLDE
jgi:hypothetical protein